MHIIDCLNLDSLIRTVSQIYLCNFNVSHKVLVNINNFSGRLFKPKSVYSDVGLVEDILREISR